jgi:chromosome segregation ATPase
LDAQQQVARAQQASTAEGLGRQMQGADLEAQARALQDQLQPLQAAAREEQARGDALQRSLDLLDLQDTGAKTAAQSAINLAQQQLIAINQTLVPLQLQADAANAYGDAIQRSLELMNLGDEPAKAFWQAAGNAATALKLDSQEAATAASDYASNLNLGADPAEKIASALERGRDALQAINTMAAEGGAGMGAIAPGGSGVSFGGITVNVNGGITGASDTEAIVAEATREFEVQFRQALRSSGSAPPPVTSSLVGARRG